MPCALGSITVAQERILIDHWGFSDSESITSTDSNHTMDVAMVDQLFSEITFGLIDLDNYLVSLTRDNLN
eukprot:4676607-Ditylum_brightwellii.AAC.1